MFFSKMHACGNDYVYFSCQSATDEFLRSFAVFASDRRKGIGGDGIIIVEKSDDYSVSMRIFNSDGSEGLTCGNGMRCAALYAKKYLGISADEIVVKAKAGDYRVRLSFSEGKTFAEADFPKPEEFLGREKLRRLFHLNSEEIFAVNAGNEHLVIVNAGFPPDKYAAISENCGIFPCGINVETVLPDENGAKVRVYERGSGYTPACGSGAIASAYVLQKLSGKSDFAINMPGGILSVSLRNDVATLKSEINEIYTGEINYEVK